MQVVNWLFRLCYASGRLCIYAMLCKWSTGMLPSVRSRRPLPSSQANVLLLAISLSGHWHLFLYLFHVILPYQRRRKNYLKYKLGENCRIYFLNLGETLFPMFGREFIGFGRREGISPIWPNTTLWRISLVAN